MTVVCSSGIINFVRGFLLCSIYLSGKPELTVSEVWDGVFLSWSCCFGVGWTPDLLVSTIHTIFIVSEHRATSLSLPNTRAKYASLCRMFPVITGIRYSSPQVARIGPTSRAFLIYFTALCLETRASYMWTWLI